MQQSPDWFNSAPAAPTPPPRRSFRIGPIIVVISILALLVVGGSIGYNLLTRQACLTTSDYKQLTGQEYTDELDPTTNFYTTLIEFQDGKSTYSETSGNGESRLRAIAAFYQSHKNTSLNITIDSAYPDTTYLPITIKRAALIKETLTKAGVPTEQIVVNQPTFTPPEEPLEYDETTTPPETLTVSIASLEGCR